MIVEITHEEGGLIGTFESPGAPRVGETIYYESEFYEVEEARWDVDQSNNESLEKFAVMVSEGGPDE